MRVLVGTLLLVLLGLQPLAGAALCVRHHAMQEGAACEAVHDGGMAPMAEDCAMALACAAPAPAVVGAIVLHDFEAPLHHAEIWSPSARRADAPAAPLFRPPIA